MTRLVQPSIILSFDTTGGQDSIAVSINGQIKGKLLPKGGSALQSSILVTELRDLLSQNGVTLAQIGTLCVLTGPGSFTGIRLGLATAQGLRLATHCHVFAPTLLDLLANSCPESIPVVDTKRGDYFVKINGEVSILSLTQLQDVSVNNKIVSLDCIPDVLTVRLQRSIAEELILFYQTCHNSDQYDRLEPFYVRTPEFVKKAAFMMQAKQD